MKNFILVWFFLSSISVDSQNTVECKGKISDLETGEPVIGALVTVKPLNTGTTTDAEGRYSIVLPSGNYSLQIGFLGYRTASLAISLKKNSNYNVS